MVDSLMSGEIYLKFKIFPAYLDNTDQAEIFNIIEK